MRETYVANNLFNITDLRTKVKEHEQPLALPADI